MKPYNTNEPEGGCCSQQHSKHQTGCCSAQNKPYETDHGRTYAVDREDICCGGGCCMHESMGTEDAEHHHKEATDEELVEPSVQEAIQAMETKLLEASDKYLRLYAEFDNFKKRTTKERIALTTHANEKTLRELLPIVDDFERGMAAWQQSQGAVQEAIQVGIQCIYDKLLAFLKRYGVEPMDLEAGHAFDADFHEAIMQKPVESPEMQGKISSVIEKGYLINGCVLRCAKVVIGL